MVAARNAAINIQASTDRRDVLPGADLVVITIGVGGRRAWEKDVFIPREFGIFQPVGDLVMPGGISRVNADGTRIAGYCSRYQIPLSGCNGS